MCRLRSGIKLNSSRGLPNGSESTQRKKEEAPDNTEQRRKGTGSVTVDLTEDVEPEGPGLVPVRNRRPQGTHDQVTRQYIAFAILGIIALLYLGSLAAFIFGALNGEGFTMAIAAISGPQALCAAVIGFYYGKKGAES